MRTFLKLRFSKDFFSGMLNTAVVAGFASLMLMPLPASEPMGDMATFITEHAFVLTSVPDDVAPTGLGAFIEQLPDDAVPVIVIKKKEADEELSDGKFSALSVKWKRGVLQVVREQRCAKHAKAFIKDALVSPLLQKAHAIVESNCDTTVVGDAGELGIYQVMPKTCRALGVKGNYADPLVNARCTEKYRKQACALTRGKCTTTFMFIAHNRGITGAKRVSDLHSLEYARKIDCALHVLQGKQCA